MPLSQVIRRFDGSYNGRSSSGCTLRIPLTPSINPSRASAAVAEMIAPRLPGISSAFCFVHSDSERLFPNPRPANSSQYVQSPAGASCLGLAQNSHRKFSALYCSSVGASQFRICACSAGGRFATSFAKDCSPWLAKIGKFSK